MAGIGTGKYLRFVIQSVSMKQCSGCRQLKKEEDFPIRVKERGWLMSRCRPCHNAYSNEWRRKNKKKAHVIAMRYRDRIKPEWLAKQKVYREHIRFAALKAYSNGKPACACCNEKILQFLCIDHTKGGGNKHRKEIGNIYRWLRREKYPKGFRVLCHNCNLAIGFYGICPHQK